MRLASSLPDVEFKSDRLETRECMILLNKMLHQGTVTK